MAISDFTIVRRSLTSRLFLTATTVLTVSVAVGLMLVLLGMKDAGFRAFERGSGNMHLIVSRDDSPLVAVLNGVFYANPPRRPIEWTKYQEIVERFPLEYAIPIQQGDSHRGHPVLATTTEFFTSFDPHPGDDASSSGWQFADGRVFEKPFEIVVGADVAKASGLSVGDELVLAHGIGGDDAPSAPAAGGEDEAHDHHGDHVHDHFAYTVVGVLQRTGGPHDRALFSDLTSTWILHAHDRRQRDDPSVHHTGADDLIDADRLITGIYLRVPTRGRAFSSGLQQIFDMLRRDTSITVAQPGQQIRTLFTIVSNIDQIFFAMAMVVMVSSGIAILLALYNSMEQRRRQIAVLRVLGFSQRRIFGLVLTESALLGVLGGVAGVILGIMGGRLVAVVMKERLGLVIDPPMISEWTGVILVATIAMASVAGLIPAVLAYRNPVAKNLAPLG